MGTKVSDLMKKLFCLGLLTSLLAGCAVYEVPPRRVVVYQPAPVVYGHYYWR
jgi:hypothetical protein